MPQARVVRNDARILDAAVEAAATDGWAGLAPTAVARRSGMSQRAVQTRYQHRPELGAAVWTLRAGPALSSALDAALESSGLRGTGSPADFEKALDVLARPDVELRAAAELLILSNFEPLVRDAVRETFADFVDACCTPGRGRLSRADAARHAYLVMVSLGLVAAGRRPTITRLHLASEYSALREALTTDVSPEPLPSARPAHASLATPFETGDEITNALLIATLDQVGELGFDGATSISIAGAAGFSEATIFLRYPTKLDMFVDAAARQQAIAFRANEEFTERIADQHGRAVSEAVNIREFLHPDLVRQRAIYAEEVRMSWHNADLRDRQEAEIETFVKEMRQKHPDWPSGASPARAHMAWATGLGYALLPLIAPNAWRLPYDVVTVPLHSSRG